MLIFFKYINLARFQTNFSQYKKPCKIPSDFLKGQNFWFRLWYEKSSHKRHNARKVPLNANDIDAVISYGIEQTKAQTIVKVL